ncbi:MAG TPA: preprotein translocase subunit SecY [Anaerohalosphaeraceae bacterium]|nr:preprotein translocase subunit SecY [Anaerohalosphaeraceae bacterium]HOM77060.1 preprotein translocase subunit SecY [Anaerohalosphaeraceae bacterium]HPC64666.1 preprotein translocase subunit SecY [Anaerohalosphaeraceae bacterium]HPO69782.1 preprotein translocase subunit SecY [Anaerohalosphaeraceae bacterium]HRS71589.1 preprotein translocase subunit SecY [Anaerohalosphaeraceae bacterium]
MLGTFVNIFKVPDLRNKILFTLALLCIYRIGFHIPVPGFDSAKISQVAEERSEESPLGRAADYLQMFTGGTLQHSSLFGLGIMPYISASIILMLMGEIIPALRKLRQEGQTGYKKIQEYTRYLTVPLCLIQALMYMKMFTGGEYIYPGMKAQAILMGVIGMTAGTIFLMWLGEQIDEYGIGNGISLIIMAGILARMPWAVMQVWQNTELKVGVAAGKYGPGTLVFLIAAFIFVVAGAILITQGQRRIPIQQAKQMRGHRMYGGARHYLPLRVNHGGVMPIIFASSLMMFPPIVLEQIAKIPALAGSSVLRQITDAFGPTAFTYNVTFIVLIFLFSYFWTTVQFQPKDMAKNLRDRGSFIPGLRPGHRTAEYLETVMIRITFFGAAFLAIIAVVPSLVTQLLGVSFAVASFLGGTGLLIVVSVSLDLVQRIEANLIMRNYEGFSETGRIKGAFR